MAEFVRRFIENDRNAVKCIDHADAVAVLPILHAVETGRYAEAFDLYKKLRCSREKKVILIDSLNALILDKRSLEWTKHGVRRSFRYWTVAEKNQYLFESQQLVDKLAGIYGNCCMGYGAALGFFREGDLIPHDDDIDLLIALPIADIGTFNEGIEFVGKELTKRGFQVRGDMQSHR